MQVLVRPNTTLPEVFEKARSYSTNEEKLAILRKHNSQQLKWFVNATYNFDFSGIILPKYKVNTHPTEICYLTINRALKRIEQAIIYHQKGNMQRYDDLMTVTLESVSKAESSLLEDLFNNKKIDGISKKVWKEMYPEFFRNEEIAQPTQKTD